MKYMVTDLIFKADSAWYDNGHVYILLLDKKCVSFPITLNKKLSQATPDQLKKMELICNGTGLHWPELDEDLSILGIMEGRFGK